MNKQEIIDEVLQDWTAKFMSELERSAASKLRSDTGEGQGSFTSQTVRAQIAEGAQVSASVMVGFKNYLRYFDMSKRNLNRERDLSPDAIEDIKEYVRRNLDKFMPGYKGPTTYKYKPGTIPEKTIINNIAWGISKKKSRIKRKQWYSKVQAGQRYNLYFRLLDELLPVMLQEVKIKVLQ